MRYFDHDPLTGIRQDFEYDSSTDTFVIRELQNVDPILKANKASFNSYSGHERWGDGDRIAFIPDVILNKLMRDGSLWDQAYMKRFLNDPDNAYLRTRPGVV
jgi:hypothetical protein